MNPRKAGGRRASRLTAWMLGGLLFGTTLGATSQPAHATYPGSTNARLAFGMLVDGNVDVYAVRLNGQDLRRLTTNPGFDACAAYSADGGRIAYCSVAGGGPAQVWTMKQNGTDKRQVTQLSGPATFPKFSPDGSEITFNARPADSTSFDIYVIGIDGSGLERLTSDTGNNTNPVYSPDGSKIAFTSDRTGTWQVWVMNADGTGQTQLTSDPLPKDQVPDWRPDGLKIAYLADTTGTQGAGGTGDIWVMNADGTNQHSITIGAKSLGTAWSPDGTRIASLDVPSRTVYTIDASDGSDQQIVHVGPGPQFVPGWQPRGADEG